MTRFMPYNGGASAGVRLALATADSDALVDELKALVGQDGAYVIEEVKFALEEAAEHTGGEVKELSNSDVNRIVTDVRKRVAVVEFEKSLELPGEQEQKNVRRIRTPEGARLYGQPIGSIITRDMIDRVGAPDVVDAPSGGSTSRHRPAADLKPGDNVNFTKPGADGKPQAVSGTVDKVNTDGEHTTVTVNGEDHKLRAKDPVDSARPMDASGVEAPEPDSQSRVLEDLRAGKIDKEAAKRRLEAVQAGKPEMIGPDGQTVTPDAPPDATPQTSAPPPPRGDVSPPDGSGAPNADAPPNRPGDFAPTDEEATHEAELSKATADDEYATTVTLPGESGDYMTELPGVSQIAEHLQSLYSGAEDFPQDDEYGSGILYALEDLDIPFDGDDDHATSVLMNRVEKARVKAFGETGNGPQANTDRIEAAGDGQIPMPAGKFSAGDPRNDPDYENYVTQLDQTLQTALANGMDTESLHTVSMPDGTKVWKPERARIHDEIIDGIMNNASGVPQDKKAIMMGGLPGAGKSTFLRQHGHRLGLEVDDKGDPTNAIVINPDIMKSALIERGLTPPVEGLNGDEHALLIHEESSHLAKMLSARALAGGYNVVFDITLGDGIKAKNKYLTNASGTGAKDLGYSVSAAFVDGDLATSLHRAGLRHKRPDPVTGERAYTGRYVPYGHIMSEAAKPGQLDSDGNPAKSKNRVEYDQLVAEPDTFDTAIRMDNLTGEFKVDKGDNTGNDSAPRPDGAPAAPDASAADASASDMTVPDDLRAAADASGPATVQPSTRADMQKFMDAVDTSNVSSPDFASAWDGLDTALVGGKTDEIRTAIQSVMATLDDNEDGQLIDALQAVLDNMKRSTDGQFEIPPAPRG